MITTRVEQLNREQEIIEAILEVVELNDTPDGKISRSEIVRGVMDRLDMSPLEISDFFDYLILKGHKDHGCKVDVVDPETGKEVDFIPILEKRRSGKIN